MILAEKIAKHRKQNGWSQEELAMRLGISRQSVSKWESTASIPDLDKIIKLSEIFGVSTDYLLKDEMEEDCRSNALVEEVVPPEDEKLRSVSLDEANSYMDLVEQSAKKIAAGVAACILSPVLLILMAGMAAEQKYGISENMATGIGLIVLLLLVAGAVGIFVSFGMKAGKYEYMETETLSLQYGIAGIVESKKETFEPVHKKCITTGVILCIVSVLPLFFAVAFDAPEMVYLYCTAALLVIVAFGVFLMVWSCMINGSYQKLLEEGDYTREKKLENKRNSSLASVYWCTIIAIYLGYSLITGKWQSSWVIWPCAGVMYAAVCGVAALVRRK